MALPALTQAQPMCPNHLERVAVRTCGRCGQFVCGGCMADGDVCRSCQVNLLAGVPSSAGRARLARGFLWVSVVAESVTILSLVLGLATGGSTNLFVGLLAGLGGILTLVGLIGGAITFLRWVHLAYVQGRALGVTTGYTPGWAVGWWFVPFANLVKPYHALRDLLSGLAGRQAVSASRMGGWWAMWVISNVIGNVDARLSLTDLGTVSAISIASSASSIAAAVLAIGVVTSVQKAVDARRAPVV